MATIKLFEDGEYILYVNGAYRGDDEVGRLMHDFSCNGPAKISNKDIAEATRYYKKSQKGVDIISKIMEDMLYEVRIETGLQNIKNVMETLAYTAEQAMDALKVPEEEREIFRTQL